jgi:DNA polymerase-3 subunit gamma/tau
MVLARKWRPKNFSELVGQAHVMQALSNALDQQRLHHAYLFTGTRGVGKTTIARIFSKALNCEQGISSQPCGVCSICRSVDEGRFVDLIEVDAASRTKVEDTREILDNVQYAPTQGRFKVYLIDEVHMLSKSSFNALLKTLEEPPAHVKFLLATTDPHKLPITVLSRCLQFNLLRLTPVQIQGHLAHILEQERVDFDTNALALLAKSADGSARDALSLLDQAIAYCGGKVTFEPVRTMLGLVDQGMVEAIMDALVAESAELIKQSLIHLSQLGVDYNALVNQLLETLHAIAQYQILGEAIDQDVLSALQLEKWSKGLSAERVQVLFQIALLARQDMTLAPDPRLGFEMALLRMLAFYPSSGSSDAPKDSGSSVLPRSASDVLKKVQAEQHRVNPNREVQSSGLVDAKPEESAPALKPLAMGDFPGLAARAGKKHQSAIESNPGTLVEPTLVPTATQQSLDHSHSNPIATVEKKTVPLTAPEPVITQVLKNPVEMDQVDCSQAQPIEDWLNLIERWRPEGMGFELARQSILLAQTKQACWLSVDPQQAIAKTDLAVQRLTESAQTVMGVDYQIHFVAFSGEYFTPANYYVQQQANAREFAESALRQDPNVLFMQTQMGMVLLEKTIQPINQ